MSTTMYSVREVQGPPPGHAPGPIHPPGAPPTGRYDHHSHHSHTNDQCKEVLYQLLLLTDLLIPCLAVPGAFMDPGDYYRTHDPLNFIGSDHSATVAAHSMYVPPSIFNLPQPPPQHYQQVSGFTGSRSFLSPRMLLSVNVCHSLGQ